MYVDSHVHLQPHGEKPPMDRARIEAYVDAAQAAGVQTLAITEHLFRFREAKEILYRWWDERGDDPPLVAAARAYVEDEVSGSVSDYVREVEAAKTAGLPVLLGLEMDWIPGRADDLRRFLAPYDWDVVLGSVHWIGPWGFDQEAESWEGRDTDAAFGDYGDLLRDLAASGLCDVLAHPDLPKVFRHRPSSFTPLHTAIVEAAGEGGCAIEVNSNGYRKPVAEPYPALPVLERAHAAGLPITLASDAHRPERVGQRFDDLAALAARAGYDEYFSFRERQPERHALSSRISAG